MEIKDFLVRYSNKAISGFIPFDAPNYDGYMIQFIKKIFGIGNFYKPLFPVQKIKDFIVGIKSIKNV